MPMTFQQAADWLFGLQRFGVKLGLEKVTRLLEELGNPHREFVSCHIAGTNGKGTAAAAVDAVLRAHGVRCGLYTSPHLVSMRERVRVDGDKVPGEFVAAWVERHRDYLEANRVTFFEVVTAMAFDWFHKSGAEAAAVEVGMGGRFDATNVLNPGAGLITSIGLEHTRFLGDTLAEIAAEKGGVAKEGVPLICGENRVEAFEAIRSEAVRAGADLRLFDNEVNWKMLAGDGSGSRFSYMSPAAELSEIDVPLVGRQAVRNVCLGIRAAELTLAALGISVDPAALANGLSGLCWPGRFQRVTGPGETELVLDVAHNPPASAKLRENLELVFPHREVTVVSAMAGDKDFGNFLEHLLSVAGAFIFPCVDFGTADTQSGAAEPSRMASALEDLTGGRLAGEICAGMTEALELASEYSGPVVVCGSFHTVGAAMAELGIEP